MSSLSLSSHCFCVVISSSAICLTKQAHDNHTPHPQPWNLFLHSFDLSCVLHSSIQDLFGAWKFMFGSRERKLLWRASFFASIWAIWKERNSRCFQGKSSLSSVVISRSRFMAASWVSILKEFWGLPIDIILIKWREVISYFFVCVCVGVGGLLSVAFLYRAVLFWLVFSPVFWVFILWYFSWLSRISLLYCLVFD